MAVGLTGVRVVERAGSPAGAYAAKLLADQGADVVLAGPRAPSWWWCAGAGTDHYLDHAKRVVEVEPGGSGAPLEALIAGADVVIESSAPDPLRAVAGPGGVDHPALVSVRISPFGTGGPYEGWRGTDCVVDAVSGHLLLTGEPDREPLHGPAHQAAYAAGLHAAIAALAALWVRRTTGRGQAVEVTHHEVMVALHQFTLLRYTHNGDVLRRMGNRYAGPGRPIGLYHCQDGPISLTVPRDDQLDRLVAVAELTHLLDHPDIGSTYDLMHHPALLEEHLLPWLATQRAEEVVTLLQDLRVPAGPVRDMAGLLADPHLLARRFWTPITVPGGSGTRPVLTPGPPFRLSADRAHDADSAPVAVPDRRQPASAGPPPPGDRSDGPLSGVRVVDLTRVWAGPLACRILADLGADVVMVEAPWARGPAGIDRSSVLATHYYPDDDPGERHWNRIGFFNKYAINKRSVALDLTDDGGREALEALLGWADVVVENYSPRVMPQLGLDEDRLHAINPGLVYVTMPGYGRSGPYVDWVAYGPTIDSHAGLSVLATYPGEAASKGGVAWPDPVAGLHAALAVLVALFEREADPRRRGGTVEVAQLEAAIAMVGHAVVERQLSGREPRRIGNRDDHHAPQGVYRTAGTDRWLALTVTDDASWAALVARAGLATGWASWTAAERHEHHDEIDDALARWTAPFDAAAARHAVAALQAEGVAAAVVADAADVMGDPHLAARRFFVTLDHPEAGSHAWPRFAARLSATPATYRRAAPLLGQHNTEVLAGPAGLAPDAIGGLERRGVLTDRPPR